MSGISSIGSSNQSALLQQLRQRQGSGSPQGAGGFPEPPKEFKAKFESAAQAAGIDTKQLAGLQDQIQSAVQGALESSDGSSDPREAVESAINGVLKDNGIDADELKTKLDSVFEKLGAPKPGTFSGVGGFGATNGKSADSTKSDLLSQLLKSLDSNNQDSGGSSILSSIRSLPPGALVDAEA
jgi:hypothetical protein